VTEPWIEPPSPPGLPDETVTALADHFEASARHTLGEVARAAEGGPDGLERLLEAAHANLTAARVLRETNDVDTWKYD
jgi:hypothetical protein